MPFFRGLSGFTLVELLVVVGIIGILVTAVMLILDPMGQIQKGNDAKRKEDLAQIQKALETYYNDFGKYPQSSADYKIIYNGNTIPWGNCTPPDCFSPYITTLPQDPIKSRNYVYYSSPSTNPQSFWLYASLERTSDPQLCPNGVCTNLPSGASCGSSVTCNFGISSTNTKP